MIKYTWADNQIKLQRAIEKTNLELENLPDDKKEKRVKEIYRTMGGRVVEINNKEEIKKMPDEIKEETVEEVKPAETVTEEVKAPEEKVDAQEEVKEEVATDAAEEVDAELGSPIVHEEDEKVTA